MPIILDGTKGETFPTWTTGTRPATPNAGQTGYNSTLATLERYNGTTWGPVVTTSDTGTVTQTMLGTNVAGNGPAFYAYSTGTQSITSATDTKVQLPTKLFDTNNNFDNTTNYRFTPTVAGYYQINVGIRFSGTTSGYALLQLNKYNGSSSSIYRMGQAFNTPSTFSILTLSDVILLNGSTEGVELYANITGTSLALDSSSANVGCFMSGSLVRAA